MQQFKSVRLPHHNYSALAGYALTLVAHNRELIFGRIENGIFTSSEIGAIVDAEWRRSGEIRTELVIDQFVVMPNHLQGIVFIAQTDEAISESERAHCRAALQGVYRRSSRQREDHSISSFVAGFKAYTTKLINAARHTPGAKVWQPNYHEHVVRNDAELERLRRYVEGNPAEWPRDDENPHRL